MSKEKPPPVAIPRRYIKIWLIVNVILVILFIVSIQYTNYLAGQLCGLISISNDTYKEKPPPSETGRALAQEFVKISKKYHCD